MVIVLRRMRRQTNYKPVLEDWVWHTLLPLIAYSALLIAALVLPVGPVPALFVIGAVTILFLFIGIHNSWDTVTYVAFALIPTENRSQD